MVPMRLAILLLITYALTNRMECRKRRKANEILLINQSGIVWMGNWYSGFLLTVSVSISSEKHKHITGDQTLRIRCQSILTDLRDQFLEPEEQFRFRFHDFDSRNSHFWCDAAGLENFYEHFDIFGGRAPQDPSITWVLDNDGLHLNDSSDVFFPWWSWQSFY